MGNKKAALWNLYFVLLKIKNLYAKKIELQLKPLMNKTEVMAHLKISDSTYRRYVQDGILNPMNLGGIDMYYVEDLVQALEKSRRSGRI